MHPRIVVIGLDLTKCDHKYISFAGKSAREQIDRIAQHITVICKRLENVEPQAQWIIAWREYGVVNGNTDSRNHSTVNIYHRHRYLSGEDKRYFKMVMQQISSHYKQLTIIAGTIGTTRQSKHGRFSIDKLKAAFAVNNWVKETDKQVENGQFDTHEQAVLSYIAPKENNTNNNFIIVRNTCYIFSQGQCIARHDKTAPHNETLGLTHAFFQPGKGRNHSSYINEMVGVEICREHVLGVLQHTCEASSRCPPLIQFVLSDTTPTRIEKICSPYFIHLDSSKRARLVTNGSQPTDVTVMLYEDWFLYEKDLRLRPATSKLMFAIEEHDKPTALQLIKQGEDPNCKSTLDNQSALLYIISKYKNNNAVVAEELVKALLADERTDPNLSDESGITPLVESITSSQIKIATLLALDNRTDPTLAPEHLKSPQDLALTYGFDELAGILAARMHKQEQTETCPSRLRPTF